MFIFTLSVVFRMASSEGALYDVHTIEYKYMVQVQMERMGNHQLTQFLRRSYAESEMNEHLVEFTVPITEPVPPNYLYHTFI